MPSKSLIDILVENQILDPSNLDTFKKKAKKEGLSLEEYLLAQNIVSEDDFYKAKAELLGFPFKKIEEQKLKDELIDLVPAEAAEHYQFIPIKVDKKRGILEVGMLNPEDMEAREALKFIAHKNNLSPEIYLISPSDFKKSLKQYKTLKSEVKEALSELRKEIAEEEKKAPKSKEEIERIAEQAPISRIVASILSYGIEARSSDIHIEPREENLIVRFRIDGVLHRRLVLPKKIHSAIVTRVKILSNLKIDETRIPQDGRFFTSLAGKKIDFRVSTFPTYTGEKVVMRILDPSVGLKSISELGLERRSLKIFKQAIQKPYGLILITGPTGSGKTTTLYSALNILNKEGVNIVSLEDPIEYNIEGINQSQIRPEIGYTFANGLRHVLRQDPDKIMVGEIRDNETAELAIHAALTGHLVLSTLHTNDAIGVIPRLIDMGVDPYLIPPTLILAVAQRLLRRLCSESKKQMILSAENKKIIDEQIEEIKKKDPGVLKGKDPHKLYVPQPSKECPEGTKGRIGIFEVLSMTPQLEKIILENPSESNIRKEAERQKMLTLLQDGLLKAMAGIVSFEEVLRAVKE